jgi:5-methylcytosine-specific restriction endonuclease McrBC GTP-binding regulatory subunit McrB
LTIFRSQFFKNDFFVTFFDNLSKIGRGRRNKDKTLNAFNSITTYPKLFSWNEISILNLYDAFGVPYYSTGGQLPPIPGDSGDDDYNEKFMDINLNQILFGPPGTGKTYHTITEAIKIADHEFYKNNKSEQIDSTLKRKNLQDRFNELLIKDWDKTEGQISFCTFHQSFSYEDFVEGIKPKTSAEKNVYYEVEDGIFKNICRLADASNNASNMAKSNLFSLSKDQFKNAIFYKISLGDSTKKEDNPIYEYCINNNVISIGFGGNTDFTDKNEQEIYKICDEKKLEGKSSDFINYFITALKIGNYVVVSNGNNYIRALGRVTGNYKFNNDTEINYHHFRSVEWLFKDVEIPVSEFYKNNLMQWTIYKLNSEYILPEFFVRDAKQLDSNNDQKKFVLVIDEINRGNVSSIFGELITLIEPSKRSGKNQTETLEVVLPYSKTPFTVPSNVYIIGTMNTADRSIESLDTALRRRFSFTEMSPDPKLIESEGKSKGNIEGVDLVLMLQKINERIEKLIDKDHKIGHSYFLEVSTIKDLKLVFKDKVIPLLEEYFFGDFGKIGLVLGNSFISKEKLTDFEFANFEDYDPQTEQDLKQRSVYSINSMEDWDYISIYDSKNIN